MKWGSWTLDVVDTLPNDLTYKHTLDIMLYKKIKWHFELSKKNLA